MTEPPTTPAATGRRILHRTVAAAKHVACSAATGFAALEPEPAHTPQDAQALAERGLAHIHAVGRTQAFADFSRPDAGFVDGDLYIFCVESSGVMLANGANPRTIGQNMAQLRGPSWVLSPERVAGLDRTNGADWIESRWPNPAAHRIEPKVAYVAKVDDHTVCGSGSYECPLPKDPPAKDPPP